MLIEMQAGTISCAIANFITTEELLTQLFQKKII